MAQQTRTTNKSRFEDGDKPGGSAYVDLIDSFLSLADSTKQSVTSDVEVPKLIATTEVSSPQGNFTEVSASAGRFAAVHVSGTMSANVAHVESLVASAARVANVSASTANIVSIDNPVQIGPAGKRGRPVLAQSKVVSAAATTKSTAANVPEGSDIINITYFQQVALASAGGTINILVGTSAHDSRFGRFNNVSAQGFYTIQTSTQTSSWSNVSGADAIVYVHTTVASGAIASGARGMLTVQYVHKQ